jgi:hypothetical protein
MMTAQDALVLWGAWAKGGRLKSVGLGFAAGGGESGYDEVEEAVRLVTSLDEEYFRAKPVLKHVFADGADVRTFAFRGPGETKRMALLRLGWFEWVDVPDGQIPGRVLERFEGLLEDLIARELREWQGPARKARRTDCPEGEPVEASLRNRYFK